jgi:ATP-binding cassette subfamily B protein
LLAPYRGAIAGLVLLTIAGNALNLLIPRLVAAAIDGYGRDASVPPGIAPTLVLAALGIFAFAYLQSVVQTYASERVARDLRTRLIARIAAQDHAYIQKVTPAALLTHLTSDVDAVKGFVSQVIASLISSVFLILGASVLLLAIDWRLALAVLAVLPFVGVTFTLVLRRVRALFKRGQEAIDWLNKVINESILGAALIRLVNSQQVEFDKFVAANTEARAGRWGSSFRTASSST